MYLYSYDVKDILDVAIFHNKEKHRNQFVLHLFNITVTYVRCFAK